MIDLSTLVAMRDEMERIQGGVGLTSGEEVKPQADQEKDYYLAGVPSTISSDLFGANGPSLGTAAHNAMVHVAREEDG